MNYTINQNVELGNTFHELNLESDKIYFLPENLSDVEAAVDFIYPESCTDLKKIWKAEGIPVDYLKNQKPLLRSRKSADWFGPAVFISFSFVTQNSHLVGVALNLLSNYLYDFFKGSPQNKKVKFDITIQTKKKEYQKISYEGPIEGIQQLECLIKGMKK